MDSDRFDGLTRSVSTLLTRRTLATVLGLGALGLPELAQAKKRKKKVVLNEFGCVNVKGFCKNNGQCCSGICEGKKGKTKCKAQNQSTCQPGQTLIGCGGVPSVPCTTSTGAQGECITTTGDAGYCGGSGFCVRCQKDADCISFCGPQAACTLCDNACAEQGLATFCSGPGACPLPT